MRIATPFCGITRVWYNELQYQRWKTQHHLGEFRGHGHDKSAPYAYGVNVGKRGITVNIHNEITMPTVETKYEKNNIA